MLSSSICTNPERRSLLRAAALLASLAVTQRTIAGVGTAAAAGLAADVAGQDWRALIPQAQALGGGDLTWFGLRIYRATLWSASRPFDDAQPFALQLHYYRSISRERLVNTSMDEIRRLSRAALPAATLSRWETLLASAFINVNEGDELVGIYLPSRGMRLYDRQRMLAEIDDQALARAFFDIWLNPDSRDKKLRQRLMGAQP
jgi:hypothetical protein